MDKLKKTKIGEIKKIKIDQESLNCPPESLNKCCKPGPFFNPDYFGHVVVQTLEELNSIPCKLRQDGMVATIVQDNYSEWQIQSSRTGFGICDNQVWVKVSAGDLVYDGGNLFIFETEQDADSYISNSHTTKQGQMLYITELDNYYKFDGQDGYTDPFPNKLEVPTTQGTDETLEYKIPTYVNGKPYWRNATDFGKVDSVNDKTPDANKNVNIDIDDVLSKGMPTSETTDENKKVLLYDDTGKSYWKSLSEVGKVKTVNNQDPDESGNIALPEQQFVKNGEGWSLKYSLDNPTFYGALGSKALDLSVSLRASVDVNFPHGAVGPYTQVFGYNNSALGGGSFVSGMSNKCQGQTNHIVSYRSAISEERGSANKGKYANGIFGGEANAIKNSIYSTILGGAWHEIIGDANPRTSASYNQSNAIIGGYKNKIISATGTNMQAYGSVIFGGEENIAQGHYNMIAGYKNHAVTIGETLVGLYGTIQNTSLSGYDFISNSRMFNVGIGDSTTQNAVTRKDGLSVFRNGLVTTPTASNNEIENNPKAVTTKEFVDNKISNFSLPTNWSNPSVRYSGILDKSVDATYNKTLVVDNNGNMAYNKDVTGVLYNDKSYYLKNRNLRPDLYTPTIGEYAVELVTAQYIMANNLNGVTGYGSIGIGAHTTVTSGNSVGINATVKKDRRLPSSQNSFDNIGIGCYVEGEETIGMGKYTRIYGNKSVAIGFQNIVGKEEGGEVKYRSNNNVVIGIYNYLTANNSYVLGQYLNNINITNCVLLGTANKTKELKLGENNTSISKPVLIVGNGNHANDTSDALIIQKNGLALLPSSTTTDIEADLTNKAIVSKEYLDIRIPKPPTTGNFVLKSADGVVSWVLN